MKKRIPTLKNNEQFYEAYTAEDRWVWNTLYERQVEELAKYATASYLEGLEKLRFNAHEIPEFVKINKRLSSINGWKIVAVEGIIEDDVFFRLLSEKKFPATTWLRKPSELDYLEEPDMFHDVFGHIPILADIPFTRFLEDLGRIGVKYASDAKITHMLSRIYWYTVEFGLISEPQGLKIYGAGILSSIAETRKSIAKETQRHGFEIQEVMNSTYHKDMMQKNYYVLDNFAQLFQSMKKVDELLSVRAMV